MRSLWIAAISAVLLIASCAGAQTAAYEATYADEQLLCVDIAASREDADRCRDQVRARWCSDGKPLNEAGACVYVPGPEAAAMVAGSLLDAPSEVNTWSPDALGDAGKADR